MTKYERQISEEIRRNKPTTTIADSFALSDDKVRPSYGSLRNALPDTDRDSSQEWQIAVQDLKNKKYERGESSTSTIQENEHENENRFTSRHHENRSGSRRSGRSNRSDPYDSIIGRDRMVRTVLHYSNQTSQAIQGKNRMSCTL